MRHLKRLLVTGLLAALLTACGGEMTSQALVGQAQPKAPLTGRATLQAPQAPLTGRAELQTP